MRAYLAFCRSDSPSRPSSALLLHTSTGSDVGPYCCAPPTAPPDPPSAAPDIHCRCRPPSFHQRIRLITTHAAGHTRPLA